MSSNHTPNFGLSQWEASDPVLRGDFNADNLALDAALAARPAVRIGFYAGNDASQRDIDLGGQPKALLLVTREGLMGGADYGHGGIATPIHDIVGKNASGGSSTVASLTDVGFTARHVDAAASCNARGTVYIYIALL